MPVWTPLSGPQTIAYESQADVIGYGGAAGGGKTDLACGLALTKHKKIAVFRRESTQLTGIIDRLEELIGDKKGYNGQKNIWRLDDRQIELCSCQHSGDETKYQGRPKDLLVIDEAANFLESQVRFIMGWVRTTIPNQKCSTLMTFNPPTNAEGRWIVEYFAPWIDKKHPNPAEPGEIRYFATMDGADVEVATGEEFDHDGETIKPQSRTFIPSRISDNPYLLNTGYMSTLQSLPEPLRSQMLNGDFGAGCEDDPWQVIPTRWVEDAQARWKPRFSKPSMDGIGVDVACGGADETIISRRHGYWFDELLCYPGTETPDGPTTASLVIASRRDGSPCHVDVVGWGKSAVDFLVENKIQTIACNGANKTQQVTQSHGENDGNLKFVNSRALWWWRLREALDPVNNTGIELPNNSKLLADLTAPKWTLRQNGIQVESKDDIKKRLGRSTDSGDAVAYANICTDKQNNVATFTIPRGPGFG